MAITQSNKVGGGVWLENTGEVMWSGFNLYFYLFIYDIVYVDNVCVVDCVVDYMWLYVKNACIAQQIAFRGYSSFSKV